MALIVNWSEQTWSMVLEAAPWLLGGFLLAGVLYVLAPVDRVTRHLGRPGLAGVLKASLFGIPLPLCSCSVIPVASSIHKQGASHGAFVSFLISTPETGVDSIAISYALLGPVWAIVRPVAAFVTAVVAGLLVTLLGAAGRSAKKQAHDGSVHAGSGCTDVCAGHGSERSGRRPKLTRALHYGLVDMMADLSPWLVAGFLLAGLAAAVIPDGFLERYIGSGISAMVVMLLIGLPLYVCSTSSTPVAATLLARGLSPGAALVFLLVGPATNIATMLVVARDLGRRGLAIYLGTIALTAVGFGLAIDVLFPLASVSPVEMTLQSDGAASFGHQAMGSLFVLLTLNGLRIRLMAALRGRDYMVNDLLGDGTRD